MPPVNDTTLPTLRIYKRDDGTDLGEIGSISSWPDLSSSTAMTINDAIGAYVKKETTKNILSEYFAIKKVIFNNPATIVYWADGTKTVVKRQKGDRWDKEKGLTMAITKKALGNKGNYCNLIKKYIEEK